MSLFPYEPSGLFLMDKPSGPTSHDAVEWARRVFDTPNVGHCGTLDPMATGLLLMVVGESLKLQNRFTAERKSYRGSFRLGSRTDTDDLVGKPLGAAVPVEAPEGAVREAFAKFTGTFEQKVPRFSAVKVNGKKMYEWARKGVDVPLPVKTVTVFRFDLLRYSPPEAEFFVECSKGTYVRSLARDVGETLGCGGALSSLCRESIGSFQRKDAYAWKGERGAAEEQSVLKAFLPHDRLEALLDAR